MHIELDAPSLGRIEKDYVTKVIDSGFVSTFGPFVSEFEEKFAGYLNIRKAVSTQSGTAALHMALYEMGIGDGDEVIVPALTFVATVTPVIYVNARPVFADVERDTWNIDPKEIERCLSSRTKAIIPVHLYGNPCNMDAIMKIAEKYKLLVIEDATESLGAVYGGRYTGTIGDLGCFSFNGNKTITTGGGGMVVGDDENRLDHIKFLVNQARDESRGYYHPEIGFNYRMTNIEAALGLAQMERLGIFSEKKRRFSEIYREELDNTLDVSFQGQYGGAASSWWLTCVTFSEKTDLPSLQKALREKGVPTRRVFMPVTEFPPFANDDHVFTNSREIYERGLCLPSSTLNSEDDVYYVCKTLKELLSS
ncbi:MAG: putative pyridoxal phosphate-dependent aminotransferase EpsN [Syntrophorhabdus sp. PtaU1.Bin058]|nr:MAG: putative pyridoxal phosphate-dependent aminotransferase EpsN [Syntrophorhabdus sp. PtaU1.Bin058]